MDPREIRETARRALGHRTLLPGQADAVKSVVDGRDTLVLLPTGGGKSAVYQLAGLERPGGTVVVSPLIALQQDQLTSLEELDLPAAALNSTIGATDRETILGAFERGELEFLLLAPEQLASDETLARIVASPPSLLVVDEAHCVSEWGTDFRPEYRRLGVVRERLGAPPILALTATASPPVRDDIVRWLGLRDPAIIARGFDRPELFLQVRHVAGSRAKRSALVEWVGAATLPGIVYVATRRAATEVADELAAIGLRAAPYHAGLGARQRAGVLDAFMADELDVVVATVAFGMGVDKPNVRFVAHHDPSDTLEAYHQEIGRAGRDGEPADAILFFDAADLGLRRFQSAPPMLPEADVRRVIRALVAGTSTADELARRTRVSRRRTEHVLARLEDLGLVRLDPAGNIEADPELAARAVDEVAAQVVAEQERRRRHALSRVELLRSYADTNGCRRRFLLNALGEEYEAPCGRCDNDLAAEADPTSPAQDHVADAAGFALGDAVVHATFGSGEVARVESDRLIVRFDSVGYRTLSLAAVSDGGLLERR